MPVSGTTTGTSHHFEADPQPDTPRDHRHPFQTGLQPGTRVLGGVDTPASACRRCTGGLSHTSVINQIWVPIAIALFGNAVAVTIVILTNRAAVKREEARQTHEARRWAREDAWKMGEVQRGYYLAYFHALRKTSIAIHNAGYEIGPALEFGWQEEAAGALHDLDVFASPDTLRYAKAVYSTLYRWGAAERTDYESEEEIEYDQMLDGFLAAVRADIGVVGTDLRATFTAGVMCPSCGLVMQRTAGESGVRVCSSCGMAL